MTQYFELFWLRGSALHLPWLYYSSATETGFISMSMEWCAVFQRLKLLRRLQEVDLSPDEA